MLLEIGLLKTKTKTKTKQKQKQKKFPDNFIVVRHLYTILIQYLFKKKREEKSRLIQKLILKLRTRRLPSLDQNLTEISISYSLVISVSFSFNWHDIEKIQIRK